MTTKINTLHSHPSSNYRDLASKYHLSTKLLALIEKLISYIRTNILEKSPILLKFATVKIEKTILTRQNFKN